MIELRFSAESTGAEMPLEARSRCGRHYAIAAVILLPASVAADPGQGNPLTLAECVSIAVHYSPQARIALSERDLARIEADRDRPVSRPSINAVASGTVQGPRTVFPRPDNTDATFLPEEAARVDFVVEQPLYRAGLGAARTRFTAEAAVAEQGYNRSLSDLALAVHKTYLSVLRAESGLRAAQDGLDAARRYQSLVLRQISSGAAKPVDEMTVHAQVAEAEAGVLKSKAGIDLARSNFNRTLGRPQDDAVALEPVTAVPNVPEGPDAAIAVALRARAELLSLEHSVRAAQAGISLARAQTQPSIGLRGQLTQQTPTALVRENYAAATIEVRWSLLDGGKARQDTREARAQAERLEALLQDARQGIILEVRTAWMRMQGAQAQLASAREQRCGLERAAVVAETAYEVGKGNAVQVLEAQREVRASRERELTALYDLYDATADFAHAQGHDLPDTAETHKR